MKNIFIGDMDELVELVCDRVITRIAARFGLKETRGINRKSYERKSTYGYGDAVNAIMTGISLDSCKHKALSLLSKDEDSDYYESVISIIQNVSLDSNKITMIEELND